MSLWICELRVAVPKNDVDMFIRAPGGILSAFWEDGANMDKPTTLRGWVKLISFFLLVTAQWLAGCLTEAYHH